MPLLEEAMLWWKRSLRSNTTSFYKVWSALPKKCKIPDSIKCIISALEIVAQPGLKAFRHVSKISIIIWSSFRSQKSGSNFSNENETIWLSKFWEDVRLYPVVVCGCLRFHNVRYGGFHVSVFQMSLNGIGCKFHSLFPKKIFDSTTSFILLQRLRKLN